VCDVTGGRRPRRSGRSQGWSIIGPVAGVEASLDVSEARPPDCSVCDLTNHQFEVASG